MRNLSLRMPSSCTEILIRVIPDYHLRPHHGARGRPLVVDPDRPQYIQHVMTRLHPPTHVLFIQRPRFPPDLPEDPFLEKDSVSSVPTRLTWKHASSNDQWRPTNLTLSAGSASPAVALTRPHATPRLGRSRAALQRPTAANGPRGPPAAFPPPVPSG